MEVKPNMRPINQASDKLKTEATTTIPGSGYQLRYCMEHAITVKRPFLDVTTSSKRWSADRVYLLPPSAGCQTLLLQLPLISLLIADKLYNNIYLV